MGSEEQKKEVLERKKFLKGRKERKDCVGLDLK